MSAWDQAKANITSFFDWWAEELKDMLPEGSLKTEDDVQDHIRILATPDAFDISYINNDRSEPLAQCQINSEALGQAVKDLRTGRRKLSSLPVRYEIMPPAYMMWPRKRPAQAARRLADLAKIEAQASTPLGFDDIVLAVEIEEKTKTTIKTRDYAIKKGTLEDILAFCRAANVALSQIGPQNSQVDFLKMRNTLQTAAFKKIQKWTIVSSVSFALIFGGLWIRQSNILTRLDEEATSLQTRTFTARQISGQLEIQYTQLTWMTNRRKSYSSATETWENLSGVLPNQAWLSELQITGRDVKVIGFAEQAAPLVTLLENHPSFESVRLAAPISLDNRRNAERFSLALRIADKSSPTGGGSQ